jgi:hypothetical protein
MCSAVVTVPAQAEDPSTPTSGDGLEPQVLAAESLPTKSSRPVAKKAARTRANLSGCFDLQLLP